MLLQASAGLAGASPRRSPLQRMEAAMSDAGLKGSTVFHNLTPAQLYEKALTHEPGTHIMSSGALATLSGVLLVLLPCTAGRHSQVAAQKGADP